VSTVAFGVRGGTEIPLPTIAHQGLGLTGPGAAGTARALLVGLLAVGTSGGTQPRAQVVIPESDARHLTGDHPVAPAPGVTPGLPDGLIITPGLGAALDHIETQITGRLRLLDTTGDEPSAAGTPATSEVPPPTLALIATIDAGSAPRVQAMLDAGARTGLVVVILGDWPAGTTCQIGADGIILAAASTGLAGAEAFRLPAPDTAVMLGLLRGAQGHVTTATPGKHVSDEPAATGWLAGGPHHRPGAAPGHRPGAPGHQRPGRPSSQNPAWPFQPRREATPPAGGHPAAADGETPPRQPAATRQARHTDVARPVRIAVLGPLKITAAGREIEGGLRKARELLAYLAAHPDGVTSERISADLWPESRPSHAASQRHLALRKAREMLRTATGLRAPMFITFSGDRYRLDPTLIEVDLWQFDSALDQARAGAGDAQVTALRQTAALYQGPLGEGSGWDWAERHAEPTRRRAVDALARTAGILQASDPEQALTVLETALAHDPYNEAVYQKIMHIQARLGRPDAARRTLALLESRLAELGVSPSPAARQAAGLPAQPPGLRPS
jgi:DNA-binding SARP family transcriptional activator